MGYAGEGEGASRDAEGVAKKMGDPLIGLPPRHHAARRSVLGVCGGDACAVVMQLTIENGESLFEVEYEE